MRLILRLMHKTLRARLAQASRRQRQIFRPTPVRNQNHKLTHKQNYKLTHKQIHKFLQLHKQNHKFHRVHKNNRRHPSVQAHP